MNALLTLSLPLTLVSISNSTAMAGQHQVRFEDLYHRIEFESEFSDNFYESVTKTLDNLNVNNPTFVALALGKLPFVNPKPAVYLDPLLEPDVLSILIQLRFCALLKANFLYSPFIVSDPDYDNPSQIQTLLTFDFDVHARRERKDSVFDFTTFETPLIICNFSLNVSAIRDLIEKLSQWHFRHPLFLVTNEEFENTLKLHGFEVQLLCASERGKIEDIGKSAPNKNQLKDHAIRVAHQCLRFYSVKFSANLS